MLSTLINDLTSIEILEWLAMLLSLAYIILAAKGSLWCWSAAFLSTALYTYIFYDFLLLMDSALNAYYLIMAIYGYWAWKSNTINHEKNATTTSVEPVEFYVISWRITWHIAACLLLALLSLVLGFVMANYTSADFPYLDTLTTVYAVFATYLVTQKVLENWLYWIVIDLVSIYLYVEKGLYPTVLLFIIFVGIAFYGYFKWRALFQKRVNHSTNNEDKETAFA